MNIIFPKSVMDKVMKLTEVKKAGIIKVLFEAIDTLYDIEINQRMNNKKDIVNEKGDSTN